MAKPSTKYDERIPPILAGVAGEYFVAAELSRRGYIASISLRNTRGIDVLVTNAEASRTVTIQCKTNQYGKKTWILNEKCETFRAEDHFYVFVALNDVNSRPAYHIVPSEIVANWVTENHRAWLKKPGKHGSKHVDTSMRHFTDEGDAYLDRWDLLKL